MIAAELVLLEFAPALYSLARDIALLVAHSFNLLFCPLLVPVNLPLIAARRLFAFQFNNSLLLEACALVPSLVSLFLRDPRR